MRKVILWALLVLVDWVGEGMAKEDLEKLGLEFVEEEQCR